MLKVNDFLIAVQASGKSRGACIDTMHDLTRSQLKRISKQHLGVRKLYFLSSTVEIGNMLYNT